MYRTTPRPSATRWPRAIMRAPKTETLLVLVPGVGTLKPEQWQDDTGAQWFEAIPTDIAPGLAVFAFPHGLNTSDNELWQKIIEAGDLFLRDLFWLIDHEKISHCPVIVAAHSLGGLIVKEALRLLYQQSSNYRPFLRSLATVLLLGTPHSPDAKDWKTFADVLHTGSGTQQKRSMTAEEMEMLAEMCKQFEDAHVRTPLVSVFETQKTKVRKGYGLPSKIMLVEEKYVTSGAEEERVIGLDADHRSLCNIDIRDRGFEELKRFLADDLGIARLNIVNGSPEYRAPTLLNSWSVIDESEFAGLGLQDSANQQDSGPASHSDPLSTWVGASSQGPRLDSFSQQETAEADRARAGPQFPIFLMPVARNKDFFGRDVYLDMIKRAFFDQSPTGSQSIGSEVESPKTFAICGPGGMGKTQLAAKFVYTFQDRFDAIFWIHSDKAAKITEGFGKIAAELGLIDNDSPDARDPVVIREQVKGWLVNPLKSGRTTDGPTDTYASWLIVFDNVDDVDEMEDYWPLDGPGCVLFTSRDPYTMNSQWARTGAELKPFDLEESSQFLAKITKKEGEDGTGVAQLLGGLPLAMTQIAAVIVRQGLSFSDFVRTYEEEESHRELFEQKLPKKSRGSQYEHNLASVWALGSLRYGGVLLDTIAFLDPDGIHEKILNSNPHVVALKDYPRTATTYLKARAELLHSSVVTKDKNGERLVVHRLIQDAARSRMSHERYRTMLTTAVALISSIWPYEAFGWRHGVARWQICEELFPHVLRIKELARHVQPILGSDADDFNFVRLMNDAGWYYHESGNSAEAGEFFNLAQEVAEKLDQEGVLYLATAKPKLENLLAEIHHNLGCVGTETNQPESTLEHFMAFKDIAIRQHTEDIEGTKGTSVSMMIAWNELGNAWMLNKEWQSGEECFLKSIECAKGKKDFDPTDVSFPMVNLGLAYWMTGRYQQAAAVIEQGLKDREDKFGRDDKDSFITGRFLHALGNVKKSQGLLDESHEFHRRALSQYLSTIGRNHHRTGDLHVKVAEHCIRTRDFDEAEKHLGHALRIFGNRSQFRHEHCRALFKKYLLLGGRGDQEAAGKEKEFSAKIYRELFPRASSTTDALTEDDVDDIVAFWSR